MPRTLSVIALITAAGCTDPQSNQPVGSPDAHSSRNSVDWPGSYSGVLPCASCRGIDTTVILTADGRFERSLLYLEESPMPRRESGSFTWDSRGSVVTLASGNDGEGQRYQVGENVLFHLDREGQRITGDLEDRYRLEKHVNDPIIENQRWRLIELHGQPLPDGLNNDAFLHLNAETGQLSGNTSCNSFNGDYAIKPGNRIRFGRNLAVTQMACPDMSVESQFLEMLQTVDNYAIGPDGTLSLNRARMAPLARLEPADRGT